MLQTKTSLQATLVAMQAGEVLSLPLGTRKCSYIRTCACTLGVDYGRKYSVRLDRANQSVTITRHE